MGMNSPDMSIQASKTTKLGVDSIDVKMFQIKMLENEVQVEALVEVEAVVQQELRLEDIKENKVDTCKAH